MRKEVRAIIHETFGEPEDVLTVQDRPLPEPAAGEVRVKTLLAPIHHHDLWTIRGSYGFKPELPARAGTEAVGIIDAIGEGVTGVTVGQRVATGGSFGAWAEYFTTKAAGLIPVPDAIGDEAAAQLVSMPFSTISLLHFLDLQPGDWLIQNAANGAVGRMVAQLGAARALNIVGLVRRAAGVQELESQGIGRIVATDTEHWQDEVRAITGGAPIVAGVESLGGRSAGDMLDLLAENGTLVSSGTMESPILKLSAGDLIFKQAVVKGFWGAQVIKNMDPPLKTELFRELIQRVLSGELTLPVESTHSFDDVINAVRASLGSGRVGKVLLRP